MNSKLLWPLVVMLYLTIHPPAVTADAPQPYRVLPGDTLIGIAARLGLTVADLVEANRAAYPCLATRPTCLQTGWLLAIPAEGAPAPDALDPAAPSTAEGAAPYEALRTALAEAVNQVRTANGLAPLIWNAQVAAAAQTRSADMAARHYFSHFDPDTGQIAAAALLPTSAYAFGCENLYRAAGRAVDSLVATAIRLWLQSPSHRQCLLQRQVSAIGSGVAQDAQGVWLVTLINARPK